MPVCDPTTDGGPAAIAVCAPADAYVCWTRMQAEAGQTIEAILQRKERERRLGGGVFHWGVGNAPPMIANRLARLEVGVPAVFSLMKSRPKAVDAAPSRVVAWRRFLDEEGRLRPLPAHVLVTSRGDGATGPKRRHHALVCRSDQPLALRGDAPPFDPGGYRNAGGTGSPVGHSQVTALLKRSGRGPGGPGGYRADLVAELTGGYWIRLVDPVELSAVDLAALADGFALDDETWRSLVDRIRATGSADAHGDGAILLI